MSGKIQNEMFFYVLFEFTYYYCSSLFKIVPG